MWYCKMYFPGRHEVIESDAFGTQGAPSQRKAFPFLESLLSFTELDTGKVAVAQRCISDDLESLDRERVTNAMVRLGALAEMHSFFRVLYAKWFYLHSKGFKNNGEKVTCALDELRLLPEELPLYQKQIQRFFELILDIDKAGVNPASKSCDTIISTSLTVPVTQRCFRFACSPRASSRWVAMLVRRCYMRIQWRI